MTEPATAPRAIASLSRNTADHRQIIEAVADAYVLGHLPDFEAFQQEHARNSICPPTRSNIASTGSATAHRPETAHARGRATQTVRLLEDGHIEELATLLGGADGDHSDPGCATEACGTTQRATATQSIADDRYEFRWEKSSAPVSGAEAGEGSTWILIGDDPDAVQPLIDALTARGHRHRILGLPVSDADEEKLADALRAAAADDPQLRIVHVAALDADATPSMRSLLRMQHRILGGTRRLFRAAIAAELRRPIWVVTRGAQRVTDADTVSPDQSACGDSVAPQRLSFRMCGADWPTCRR